MSFQPVSTANVQAESLRLFMQQLGYFPSRANGGFTTDNPYLQRYRQISTATAIKLHNKQRAGWVKVKLDNSDVTWYKPKGLNVEIMLTAYGVNTLLAAKLVKQVKFQASRRALNGLVFPTDPLANLIKPQDTRYFGDFGIEAK